MSGNACLLADASDNVKEKVSAVTKLAKQILAEAAAFNDTNVERLLAADHARLLMLVGKLGSTRSELAEADEELKALRRRAQ